MNYRLTLASLLLLVLIGACRDASEPAGPTTHPSILSFSPPGGPPETYVVVQGRGFGDLKEEIEAAIGGHPATIYSVTSDEIVIVVPEGAVTGAITIKRSGQVATSITEFTVTGENDPQRPPELLILQPSSCQPGQNLQITGGRFGDDPQKITVLIGGLKVPVTVQNAGQISVTVPGSFQPGPVKIAVKGQGWTDTARGTLMILRPAGFSFSRIEFSLESVMGTYYRYSMQSLPDRESYDTTTTAVNITGTAACAVSGCISGSPDTVRLINNLGQNYNEHSSRVQVVIDTTARRLRYFSRTETEQHSSSPGHTTSSQSSSNSMTSFTVRDVPYVIQPDGSLRCRLSGTELAATGLAVESGSSYTSSDLLRHQYSQGSSRLAGFDIPPGASLVITMR